MVVHEPGSLPDDWGLGISWWIPDTVLALDQARHLRLTGRLLDLATRPIHEDPDAWRRLAEEAENGPWYGVLTGVALPAVVHLWPRVEAHRARLEVAAIALAIRIHEIRHGSPPSVKVESSG